MLDINHTTDFNDDILPTELYAKILSYLPEEEIKKNRTVQKNGSFSDAVEINLLDHHKILFEKTNNSIIELNQQSELPDLSGFFTDLVCFNDFLNNELSAGCNRREIIEKFMQEKNNRNQNILNVSVFKDKYKNKITKKRQAYVKTLNSDCSIFLSPASITLTTVISLQNISFTMWPFVIAGVLGGSILLPLLIIAAVETALILSALTIGSLIAKNQLLNRFDKKYQKSLELLDNFQGFTELTANDAEENTDLKSSEKLRGLFLNSTIFENTNSTGIQVICDKLRQRPFMSSESVFSLIQKQLTQRSQLNTVHTFFCRMNRAESIQQLYDLTRDPEFDLVNNPTSRTLLIDKIEQLEAETLQLETVIDEPESESLFTPY